MQQHGSCIQMKCIPMGCTARCQCCFLPGMITAELSDRRRCTVHCVSSRFICGRCSDALNFLQSCGIDFTKKKKYSKQAHTYAFFYQVKYGVVSANLKLSIRQWIHSRVLLRLVQYQLPGRLQNRINKQSIDRRPFLAPLLLAPSA